MNTFTEYEAAVMAGLDLWRWENGEYPKWFMERVVAYYLIHHHIDNHKEDAAREFAEKRSK